MKTNQALYRILSVILISAFIVSCVPAKVNHPNPTESQVGLVTETELKSTTPANETPQTTAAHSVTQVPATVGQERNTVHPIEEEHMVIDKEKEDGYVDNIIVLIVKPEVKEDEVLAWFPGEDASIAGRFPGIHQLQVRIKPRSRQELNGLAETLMAKEQVLFAHLDLAVSTGAAMPELTEEPIDQATELPPEEPVEEPIEEPAEEPMEEEGGAFPPEPSQVKPENEWWYEVIKLKEAQAAMPENLVKVAVVDDGFDTLHPYLKLAYVTKENEETSYPESHGTHVAGVVQQILPKAQITVADSYRFPGKMPMGHYATLCHHLKILMDLLEADVKVVNYSMGADVEEDRKMPWQIEMSGINSVYIYLLKQLGYDFILVQSAGNLGLDAYRNGIYESLNAENCLGSEAARKSLGVSEKLAEAQKLVFDSIVIVSESEKKNADGKYPLLDGSNYGEKVDIVAPGDDILSSVPGGYDKGSGTSEAAPVVTGALGLLWSLNPELKSGELKDILIKSATETAHNLSLSRPVDKRLTYPILNLFEAVKMVQKGN